MKCEQLNHALSFFPDKIESCCSGFQGPIYIKNPTNDMNIDLDKMFLKKKNFIYQMTNNKIKYECKNCPERVKGKPDKDIKIRKIFLNHFTHCNCKCVYCARLNYYHRDFTEEKTKSAYYDALPIIKNLYENNYIDTLRLIVEFQGGDLNVLEEFEDITDYLIKHGLNNMSFITNNINYQPVISDVLKKGKGLFISSLDCGCAETYKKIKRVDKFDNFLENLAKYQAVADPENILIKYILVRHFNDSIEEIDKFLNLMNKMGVKKLQFELNYNDILLDKNKSFNLPPHYIEIYNYFKNFCIENNINMEIFPHTKKVLTEGHFN